MIWNYCRARCKLDCMQRLVPWFVASVCSVSLWGQHSTTTLSNPFNTNEDRLAGSVTFRSQCASCHGSDAKGTSAAPDLSRGQFKHAVSEEAMFRVITKGIPGTTMPGFALDGRNAWQVVSFIYGLNVSKIELSGDASLGSKLFEKMKCGGCHTSGAPNLRDAAAKLSRSEMRQSLLEPDAAVAPEYWRWRGKLKNGSTAEGRRFNEDTFVVQLLGDDKRLRTIYKKDVESSELSKRSQMPSFRDRLSPAELDHLVAYLESLRGTAK
jgi:putative heme-binding domain-containing protein